MARIRAEARIELGLAEAGLVMGVLHTLARMAVPTIPTELAELEHSIKTSMLR